MKLKLLFLWFVLVVFTFGCSTIHMSGSEKKTGIFFHPDWNKDDVNSLETITEYTFTGYPKPQTWSSSSNPNIIYSVDRTQFILNNDYFVKRFRLQKENVETKEIVIEDVLASKPRNGEGRWKWNSK